MAMPTASMADRGNGPAGADDMLCQTQLMLRPRQELTPSATAIVRNQRRLLLTGVRKDFLKAPPAPRKNFASRVRSAALKIPVWWRRAVLPSLPWVVCFLSFFALAPKGGRSRESKGSAGGGVVAGLVAG